MGPRRNGCCSFMSQFQNQLTNNTESASSEISTMASNRLEPIPRRASRNCYYLLKRRTYVNLRALSLLSVFNSKIPHESLSPCCQSIEVGRFSNAIKSSPKWSVSVSEAIRYPCMDESCDPSYLSAPKVAEPKSRLHTLPINVANHLELVYWGAY
jgi:hypothetical protein